ncbi:MAG: tetratricopeptide repeat protein, partial [Pseudomonadota bacterium]
MIRARLRCDHVQGDAAMRAPFNAGSNRAARVVFVALAATSLWNMAPTPAFAQNAVVAESRPGALGPASALGQGRAALSAGDFAAAETAFRRALETAPANRQATLGLALTLDKLGRGAEAIPLFDDLVAARPEDPTAIFYRGVARYRIGALDDAITDFEAAIGRGAGFPVVRQRLGDAHYAKGDYRVAEAAYRSATSGDNPPPAAFRALGNALYAQDKFEAADAAFSEALEADPQDGRAALHRGWTRQKLGQDDAAFADINRAYEILGGVDADVAASRGDLHRRRGALQAAILDYQTALEVRPGHRRALYGAAAALLMDGRPAAAEAVLDELLDSLSDQTAVGAAAFRLRGEALLRIGEAQRAEADLSLALRLSPDVAVAHYNRGLARALIGDFAGALDDMRQAASLAPGDPEAAYGHLRAAIAAGLPAEAQDAAAAAEALAAERPAARPARAAALLAFGRPNEALSLLNQHLVDRPRDLRSLHLKIRTLFALNRPRDALDLSRRLIILEPRRALNHIFEAEARVALGQSAEAREALQRANALGAEPARIARLAGGAWLAAANAPSASDAPAALRQAADALDAAVSLSNKSPDALAMRAATLERIGRLEQ